jgi:hypothetical protein
VIYNKSTGRIDVYVNGIHLGFWQDSTPLTVGNAISFRSGNATLEVDDIVMYRSRTANETITAGSPTSMLRFENPSPNIPAGSIRSKVVDDIYLLGGDTLLRDVDFTAPVNTALPTEEQVDVDTILNLSSFLEYANVYADPHSGLNQVMYGIGSAPGLDDILSYSSMPAGDSISISTAGLMNGMYYYFNLYAINNASFISDTISSDGFLYINTAGLENQHQESSFYPNPASSFIFLELKEEVKMELVDVHGKVVINRMLGAGTHALDVQELSVGYYFLSLGDKSYKLCIIH